MSAVWRQQTHRRIKAWTRSEWAKQRDRGRRCFWDDPLRIWYLLSDPWTRSRAAAAAAARTACRWTSKDIKLILVWFRATCTVTGLMRAANITRQNDKMKARTPAMIQVLNINVLYNPVIENTWYRTAHTSTRANSTDVKSSHPHLTPHRN